MNDSCRNYAINAILLLSDSILQQDSHDLEVCEPDLFPTPSAKRNSSMRDGTGPTRTKVKTACGGGRRGDKWAVREKDVEELKKMAAVECLMSVTDGVRWIHPMNVDYICFKNALLWTTTVIPEIIGYLSPCNHRSTHLAPSVA